MSWSFYIKLDKIREFYQVFNICAVHVYAYSKMIGDNIYISGEGHAFMKRSLLYGLNLSRKF